MLLSRSVFFGTRFFCSGSGSSSSSNKKVPWLLPEIFFLPVYNKQPSAQKKTFFLKDLFFNLNLINVDTKEENSIQNFFSSKLERDPVPDHQTGSGQNVPALKNWSWQFMSVTVIQIPSAVLLGRSLLDEKIVRKFFFSLPRHKLIQNDDPVDSTCQTIMDTKGHPP